MNTPFDAGGSVPATNVTEVTSIAVEPAISFDNTVMSTGVLSGVDLVSLTAVGPAGRMVTVIVAVLVRLLASVIV